MRAQLGTFFLMLGLTSALLGIVVLGRGIATGDDRLLRLGRRFAVAILVAAVGAMAAMQWALNTHDYSIKYVANNVANATPRLFTITAAWSALEGSILLWALMLGLYVVGTSIAFRKRASDPLVAWATIVQFVVVVFFFGLMVTVANPFALTGHLVFDGNGPNPLLQNHPLVAFHPPFLYAGYVGMTIPFSFAIAALVTARFGEGWLADTRRASLIAWGFLTIGIVLGAWWSYEVLGWGGYWGWDPVENASLLPWLTATAFLHSVMVQERRGMLRLWNLNLVVGTFVLTILGTFLTRSGIISSVHAFTTGTIGYYFLAFIAVTLLAALALVAGTSGRLTSENRFDSAASRETVFLLNNLFLTAFMFTVLLGTLFPLVAESVRGVKVSVGEPFFNRMSLPMIVVLLFLMGVGPAMPWKRIGMTELKAKLRAPLVGAIVMLVVAIAVGARNVYALVTFAFVGFSGAANKFEFWYGMRARHRAHGENYLIALLRLMAGNRRRYGGYVAHLGILTVALGIAASSTFRTETEATLKPGDSMTVSGHTVRLKQVWGREEVQRSVIGATLEIVQNGAVTGTIEPKMNFYPTSQQPVPTPQVNSSFAGDLYANLQAFRPDGSSATVRLIYEPLVPWIWFGGMIVVFGSILSMLPARTRGVDAVATVGAASAEVAA